MRSRRKIRIITRRQPEDGKSVEVNEWIDWQAPDAPALTEVKGFFCIQVLLGKYKAHSLSMSHDIAVSGLHDMNVGVFR